MKLIRKFLAPVILGISAAAASVAAWAAPTTHLGFILDASGSVSTTNYNQMRSGLNAALAGLPVDGSVEITVTSFSTGVATVIAPTVLTAATLPGIQSAISTHVKSGGTTSTGAALTYTTNLMNTSVAGSDKQLINLLTDGVPCCQTNADALASAGAAYAAANGIDALSIEAIGTGVSSASALNQMASWAFPGPATILAVNATDMTNPLGGSWVVPVSDFDALEAVLKAKVIASITPVPEPGTIALLSLGFVGLGFAARRKSV